MKKNKCQYFYYSELKGSNSQWSKVVTGRHCVTPIPPCSIPRVKATRLEDAAAYTNFWHSTPHSSWSLIVLPDSLDSLSSREIWGGTSGRPDLFTVYISGKMKNYFPGLQSIKFFDGFRINGLKKYFYNYWYQKVSFLKRIMRDILIVCKRSWVLMIKKFSMFLNS